MSMSENEIKIVVTAANQATPVFRDIKKEAEETFKAMQREISKSGVASKDTMKHMADLRSEVNAQNRAVSTLRKTYQDQHQTLSMTADAFQSFSNTVGKAQRMYEQYNVAQIKTNQLARDVKDAQEKYNAALTQFGPSSKEAIKAQGELKEASEKLATAQQENVMQLIGFGLQAPAFLKNILDMKDRFSSLALQLGQVKWAEWGTSVASACGLASTGVKGLATSFGLLTIEITAALGAGYAMVQLLEKFGGPATKKAIENWKTFFGFTPEVPTVPTPLPSTPITTTVMPIAGICGFCGANTAKGEPHKPDCPYYIAPTQQYYGAREFGGYIQKTGLYLLHGGEEVTRADQTGKSAIGGGPVRWDINVTVIGDTADHRTLARNIAKELVSATEGRRRL